MATSMSKTRPAPGRKGAKTRARLLTAAREMLRDLSPLELTVVSVSRRAGTGAPSFYVYFNDIRDLMLALSNEVAAEPSAVVAHIGCDWPPPDLKAWCDRFVALFVESWQADAAILSYRNLEADRGDPDFDDSRVRASLPVLEALTARMLEAHPEGSRPRRVDAFAEAVLFYAGLERLAAASQVTRPNRLHPRYYAAAFARQLFRALEPGFGTAGGTAGQPRLVASRTS